MKRNILIAYFLSFAFHSWFWMGNWIFYYLRFGDYSTIALLDSIAVTVSLVMEIPTGAFADLIGKKKTLIIAFLLQGIGNIIMGFSNSFIILALSLWFLVCIGGAFYSGTLEALVFDSLKVSKLDNLYAKKIGIINATKLWSMAICGIIGGFSYYIFPGFPFVLNGLVCFLGLFACLFLSEPSTDTQKYSLGTFFRQNTLGIKTLFSNSYLKKISIYLALTGACLMFTYQILDDLLAIEFGYTPISVSFLFAIVCIMAGIVSVYLPRVKKKLDHHSNIIITILIIGILLSFSPLLGLISGGILLFLRVLMEVIYENSSSVIINENTPSAVRSTTLSSLSLLRSLPYALGGSFIGIVIQQVGGAKNFALWFGLVIVCLVLLFGLRLNKKPVTTS